ncbi:MAG TPA: isoprenylcysteine carboxylmethyltransferase family protein [Methylomirabilota bacterium]|nr:isoprenylcysteine carboxylmethyltransferase family protein [Methylomirabilota bacterium]
MPERPSQQWSRSGLSSISGYRRRCISVTGAAGLPSGTIERDNGSKWWLIASVWVTVAAGIGVAELFPNAAIKSGRDAVFVVGLVLMIAGLALRWYSIWVLGTSFTCNVATRPGQQVVQSGPYRWVRHPSYTGGLLTVLGVLVCCLNWASLAALILVAFGYANRIRVEERALAADLGSAYRDYMRRTRRLIPFLI